MRLEDLKDPCDRAAMERAKVTRWFPKQPDSYKERMGPGSRPTNMRPDRDGCLTSNPDGLGKEHIAATDEIALHYRWARNGRGRSVYIGANYEGGQDGNEVDRPDAL
jgi:hypothetical protein